MHYKAGGIRVGDWWPVMLLAAVLAAFRLFAMAHTDLNSDEAYYWLWSRVPSAGYYDHPPMIAWWIWLSTHVFGDTALGVRALPVLSVSVASLAVYATVIELYDDTRLAFRSAVWLNAMFLVGLEAIFATPDAPSVMFWSLTIWALARLRRTENPLWWIVVGVLAGAGCVGKYTNFFIGPGILLWLLLDPRAVRWRFSPWILLGGLAAFAVFMPVLVWNADHGWASFAKQFGRLGDHHPALNSLATFIGGQFGLMNPVIAIFAGIAVWRFCRHCQNRRSDPFIFLVALTAPLVAYLIIHSLHDWVHPNWPAPAYPALAIAAAVAGEASGNVHLRRLRLWVVPVGIGLSSLLPLYLATPMGERVPFTSPADTVIGWQDLTTELEGRRQQTGAAWIATTDYGLTGEIAFYSHQADKVQSIVDRQRYTFESPDASLAEKSALLVVRTGEGRLAQYLKCFRSTGPVEHVARRAGTRVIDDYSVVAVSGAAGNILSSGCQAAQ